MTHKRCLVLCGLLTGLFAPVAGAAVPPFIKAQGQLRNAVNAPVDGVYDLLLALYDAPTAGTKLWSQTYSAYAVTDGHFEVTLGNGFSPLPIPVLAGVAGLYLGVAVAGEPELDRVPLLSTPYALISASADTATTAAALQCTGCVTSTHLATGAVSASAVTYSGATSALAATNAQAALDELAGKVATLSQFVNQELKAPSGAALPTCDAGSAGRMFLDTANEQLMFCVGGTWRAVGRGGPRLEFTPVALDFDQVSATRLNATLRNTGDVEATGVVLSATGDFTVNHDCTATLLAGAACTATFEMKLGTGQVGKLAGSGTAVAAGGLTSVVVLSGTPPSPRSCLEQKQAKGGLPDGLYTIDVDGVGGEPPVTAYCDMTTDGGGWTLAAYCSQGPGPQNFWDLRCGGGDYEALNRNGCASLKSVPLARGSTEMLLARSNSDSQTGNILAYAVATKFSIPDPEHVNFVNHSTYGPFTGSDITQRGPCTAVTLTTLKGPNYTGATRYTFKYSLGASWNDSYPTGYGANPNSNCSGTWSQGPFFTSVHSGSGHPSSPGGYTNACVTNGKPSYNHQDWYDPDGASKTGSASIWFR